MKKCPICGSDTLETKIGEFRFNPPDNIPGGTMLVPDTTWDACSNCGEEILSYELSSAIDKIAIERLRGETT